MNGHLPVSHRHVSSLDGIRAVACWAVIAFHLDLLQGGFVGIDIFFVLSGSLITSILDAEWARTGRIDFGVFPRKRLLRLLPSLTLCVIGYGAYCAITGKSEDILVPVASALLYATNYLRAYKIIDDNSLGHTWSLAVEMQFYAVWPFVFAWFCRHLTTQGVMTALANLAAIVTFWRLTISVAYGDASMDFTYRVLETRADGLLIGGILALMVRQGWRFNPTVLLLISSAFIVVVCWRVPTSKLVFHEFGLTIVAMASAYIIGFLVDVDPSPIRAFFSNPVLAYLGKISYGAYLYHYPIIKGLEQQASAHVALFGITSTLAIASASYVLVESPVLRFQQKHRGREAAAGRVALWNLALPQRLRQDDAGLVRDDHRHRPPIGPGRVPPVEDSAPMSRRHERPAGPPCC